MSGNVDLSQLVVRRDQVASSTTKPRRVWLLCCRIILPGIVLFSFLCIGGWAARDSFLPARPVTVVPVVTTYVDMQTEGTPLFQAAGWIEPRPTPILVTALTEGVVEMLIVVEGQKIDEGHVVARLIQDDAKLALQTAEADRELQQAAVEQAKAALSVMRAHLPTQLAAARSNLDLAKKSFDSAQQLFDAASLPYLSLTKAKTNLDAAASAVAELEIRQGTFKADTIRPFAEAEATVKSALARLKQAETGVALAKLRLDRTVVKSPVAGQVITLVAKPGQRLMGQAPTGMQDASTVITMFNPKMIQVRADVRLEDVPKVQPGQLVRIETPVAAGSLDGEVLQITSQADIQKNTLQATFLALAPPNANEGEKQSMRLMIPKQLVESAEGSTHVWIADLAGKIARKKLIKLGRSNGEYVEVVQGVNVTDRLILDGRQGLNDGQRIDVTFVDVAVDSPKNEGGVRPARSPNPAANKDHSGKH
jgi:HlyD family secretion protein